MLKASRPLLALATVAGFFLAACAPDGGAAPSAASSGASSPAASGAGPATADLQTLLAQADAERGKVQFLQCRACHSLEAGGPNKVGPNLHGVLGRKAGAAPGFAYSEAMTGSAVVWTAETIDAFLTRPSAFIAGNRMVFVGVRKPQDRADLIAYLQRETAPAAKSSPIAESSPNEKGR